MNIGCITLIRRLDGKILAVRCNKGRGYILPGGKLEEGETFIECAKRELKEEAGLDGEDFKYFFGAPDGKGYFCLCFTAVVKDFDPRGHGEMPFSWVDLATLKLSSFKAYYELLETVM